MSVGEMLGQPVNTLAFCWRIERRDGVTIGLTSHDRDLMVGGLLYRAAPGMTPSAIRSGIGLDGEDSDVGGARRGGSALPIPMMTAAVRRGACRGRWTKDWAWATGCGAAFR